MHFRRTSCRCVCGPSCLLDSSTRSACCWLLWLLRVDAAELAGVSAVEIHLDAHPTASSAAVVVLESFVVLVLYDVVRGRCASVLLEGCLLAAFSSPRFSTPFQWVGYYMADGSYTGTPLQTTSHSLTIKTWARSRQLLSDGTAGELQTALVDQYTRYVNELESDEPTRRLYAGPLKISKASEYTLQALVSSSSPD